MKRQIGIILVLATALTVLGCATTQTMKSSTLGPVEARDWLRANPAIQLIDVRTEQEYSQEHLAGAKLIPVQEMGNRLGEIDKEKPVLLYCHAGKRSQEAADLLKARGFKDLHQIEGGITAWKEKDLPVEMGAPIHHIRGQTSSKF